MQQLKPALITFLFLSLITGIIYPLVVLGFGQTLFSHEANGSLIEVNKQLVGSSLIGQNFRSNKYLWSRPSATSDHPYNALASGGTNLGPSNPQLIDSIKARVESLGATSMTPVPIDLVTSSGSGLDPEISIASAYFQMARIAKARGISQDAVEDIINKYAQSPILGFFGEARVNVLQVNLALDGVKQ